MVRKPFQPVQRLRPGADAAFRLVHGRAVMIEADPHCQPVSMLQHERLQCLLEPPHRPHRVGQDQHIEAALQRRAHHRHHVPVHEGLAAGEADLARAERLRLVEIGFGFGEAQIDERVVGR